jgi:Domain of unknown function (DUF4192)
MSMLSSPEQLQPVRGMGEVLELIPYLLGFHPADSVVLLDVGPPRRRIGMTTLRVDLDKLLADPEWVGELVGEFTGSGAVVVVIYGAAERSTALLFPRFALSLRAHGVKLEDAVLVDGGLWWSMRSGDLCCRPETGTPVLPLDGPPTPMAALAAFAGLSAQPDREALRRSLDPLPGPDEDLFAEVLLAEAGLVQAGATRRGLNQWRAATIELFRTTLREARSSVDHVPTNRVPVEDIARLIVGMLDLVVRDGCWRALEVDSSSTAFNVCWDLVRRAREPYRAPALFLLGWVAWRRGDGVLGALAAEQCLAADAGYDAARLLQVILDRGIMPAQVPRLRPSRRGRRLRRRPS